MKQLKKFNQTNYNIELKELKQLKILVVEKLELLKQLDVKNITELEDYLLKATGFKNIQMSATALGVEKEYNRILEIGKLTENKISDKDITADFSIKKTFLKKLKDKHSTFYTDKELDDLNTLKEVLNSYNKLPIELRGQLIININGMQINPFSYLLR
ncbi:MAG: hypothetical protein GY820_40175 [Gammaproteobacteria bacterium]|uniref:hypothetical protein n=1 Tax=Herbaspirillum sp. TaxID=1890675 RepID=UPI0025841D79|nr:hypothetical protein [Herbaspirillum sp.]MCP3654322.1 hypothetical protein [Herbaspirillum sp.]MCP4493481.1 hypothetical protein [Gammaproteobacteria bacterium]